MDEVLDLAPCGFISFKDDGSVTDLNQTLADLLGISKEDLIGRHFETILTLASRIFYNTHLFPLLKLQGRADEIFISLRGTHDKDVPVLLNAKRKKSGEVLLNELILMPIHQRRKYEDELLAAKKNAEDAIRENQHLLSVTKELETRTVELDKQYARLLHINRDHIQFSKVISHDLQETIHKLNVFSDKIVVEEWANLSDRGKTSINKISKAIQKASELINGLHNFIQVNEQDDVALVDLNEVLLSAKAKAQENLKFDDFDFAIDQLPSIEGSYEQIEEMFYQLIANSIHYRQPGRRLQIDIEHTLLKENKYRHLPDKYDYTDHVRIRFRDNGLGFDHTLSEYIFSLFKKIQFSSTGLGIGLALVKKIVENHAGSIAVNTRLGEGTEFTILLPLLK